MIHYKYLLFNLILCVGVGLVVSNTLFFIYFTGGGSARHLRGSTEW